MTTRFRTVGCLTFAAVALAITSCTGTNAGGSGEGGAGAGQTGLGGAGAGAGAAGTSGGAGHGGAGGGQTGSSGTTGGQAGGSGTGGAAAVAGTSGTAGGTGAGGTSGGQAGASGTGGAGAAAGTSGGAGRGGASGTSGGQAGAGGTAGSGATAGTSGGAGRGGAGGATGGGGGAGQAFAACPNTAPAAGTCAVTGTLQTVPALPRNACNNASLPQAWGTNFPTPDDPSGWGVNATAMGWEGNWWPSFEYLSGAFFARGVGTGTYKLTSGTNSGTTLCGSMFSFGVMTAGGTPAAGAVQWTMDSGYLPAFTSSLTRGNLAISVKNFEDMVTIGGNTFGLVYSRVTIMNNGTASATVDPQPSAGLAALTNNSTTVAGGQSVSHDYVVAVDNFGSGQALPTGTALTGAAPTFDNAYTQMAAFWNGRLAAMPTLNLPNITIPMTGLANPGTELSNAFKANFVYTRIVQVGKAPFSGANNYAWLLNHDLPHILANRFTLGDFQDAQNLLLSGRVSEESGFPNNGANWYLDGLFGRPPGRGPSISRRRATRPSYRNISTIPPPNGGPASTI